MNAEIKDVNITVKIFDENVTRCLNNVSQGLLNLTELFKAENVKVTGINIVSKELEKINTEEVDNADQTISIVQIDEFKEK